MGRQARARRDRRESTRRFGKAVKKGWIMPTPPPALRKRSPYPLIAIGLWIGIAVVAAIHEWPR